MIKIKLLGVFEKWGDCVKAISLWSSAFDKQEWSIKSDNPGKFIAKHKREGEVEITAITTKAINLYPKDTFYLMQGSEYPDKVKELQLKGCARLDPYFATFNDMRLFEEPK